MFRVENRSARIHCSLLPGQAKEYSVEEMSLIAAAVAGAMCPVAQRLVPSTQVLPGTTEAQSISAPTMQPQRSQIHVFAITGDGEQELSSADVLKFFEKDIQARKAARLGEYQARQKARTERFALR